ncbi:hypothetical protein H8356DRAFT_1710766 [Neocallimastix lanati (nom. inval.)]|nr:hypothetical protein H8356DRAFT_1710766 [Neocallimastix sp. JGI-2020a]
MKIEKSKISIKNEKSKTPRTIKDIEDTLKEMDKIHSTSFYDWIKDENNASVIAFKTKDLFQEHYEKQPELVYNVLRFLCKDWKISKIAELILKLFYKSNIASQKLAVVIYEVSLLLENPEKVDLISLLLIGEEAKNVAFFVYHFFQYTEKKYREHTEILNEEEFLDEMNAFCSGMLECLYSILKWNDNYFKELIIEYINLSTLKIDARHEFLIRMVNVKYSRFQQEQQSISNKMNSKLDSKEEKEGEDDEEESSIKLSNKLIINDNNKIKETEENFKKSLNFGILVFNMFQIVMRTEIDELMADPSPKKEISNKESSLENDIDEDYLSDNSKSISNRGSKKIMLRKGEEEEEEEEDGDEDDDGNMTLSNTENDLSSFSTSKRNNNDRIKKEESSATLWMEDCETCNHRVNDSFSNNDYNNDNNYNEEGNTSKDISSIYNFGYDSSYCKINNNNESNTSHENEYTESELYNTIDESLSESLDECSFHIDELYNETIRIGDDNVNNDDNVNDNVEDLNDINLFDDFFNKSFTSTNSNSRRNSTLSFASFISDHNLDEIGNNKPDSNGLMDDSSSTRRNSRYSLNLSINSDSNNSFNSSNCNCSCNCRYNYTDNLLYIFPSPPNSSAIASAPPSPTFLLNNREYEFDFESNPSKINSSNNNNNCSTTITILNTANPITINTNINTNINMNHTINEMEDINNSNFLNDNNTSIYYNMNSNCSGSGNNIDNNNNNNINNSLTSPPPQFYRSFSPETISPSPIVQSLSVDNLFLNNYGYSCTFHHIHSSPNLTPLQHSPN